MSEFVYESVDKAIRKRLLSLQTSFFQSLQSGTDALAALFHEMTSFNEAVGRSEQYLEEETRLLIYSFAQTSIAVIPGLIDLDVAVEKINQELNEDMVKVLVGLSLDDTPSLEPETYPAYIQPAYTWLLNHLHNPYPPKQTRTILSKQTNTPQKDIDSWFTDVRKRIGWNSLRKKHFSTRKDMIAAATQFFKPSIELDSRSEPEKIASFDQEFALLEDNAKNLYSRKFSTSILADRLEVVDVTPENNPAGQRNLLARRTSSQEIEPVPDSLYSSPEFVSPSPPTFPSPSPPPSLSHPSSQNRKRRQSISEDDSGIEARPLKRTRINTSADLTTCSPFSIQSDARQHSPTHLDPSPSSNPSISISETSRKRKRQSLDSDQGRTKRPHCIPPPASNSSMDPLRPSNSVDLDQWLNSVCSESIDLGHSIPEPVYETSPSTAAVEIDFYRYGSFSPSTSVSSLGPSTPPDYNTSDSPPASYEPLSWLESPSLTKAQGYDSLADVAPKFLPTNWSEESFVFDLNSPGILDADFPFQNWDLASTPAMSPNNYSISKLVDESTQPWTNEAVPISVLPNQLSPPTSFSDNGDNTLLPQVFRHPSLDKKDAKIRYLQTLLNEVQNVRLDLAI